MFKNCPNGMFVLVKGLQTDSIEVKGGSCMTRSDGKIFSVRREVRSVRIIWKVS